MNLSHVINQDNKPVPTKIVSGIEINQKPYPLRPDYKLNVTSGIVPSDITPSGITYGSAGNNIRKSVDFGTTTTTIGTITGTLTPTIAWVLKMDDGSVVSAVVNRDLDIGEIWRSDVNEASFTKVHTFTTPKSKPSATFGYSRFKNILLVAEYGTDKSFPNNPRRCYMSLDFGATWTQILEIWNVDGAHPHDIQYDPYEDIIWVVSGDGVANRLVWYSIDRGVTWKTIVPPVQYTNISILPNCVLFGTDTANIVGFYRLDRPKSGLRTATNLQIVEAYIQTRTHPQMPIACKSYSDFNNGIVYSSFYETAPWITMPATIYATKDGVNFYIIWQSETLPTATANGVGVLAIAGVSSDGNLIAYVRMLVNNTLRLTIPSWVGVSSDKVDNANSCDKWFSEPIADISSMRTYYGKTKANSSGIIVPTDISNNKNIAIYLKNNGTTTLSYFLAYYDTTSPVAVGGYIFKTADRTLVAGAEIILNSVAENSLSYPFRGFAVAGGASTPTGTLNLMIIKGK